MTKRFPVLSKRKTTKSATVDWGPRIIAMREQAGLTQKEFSALIGVSSKTLENWEQGRRQPTGPAGVLLRVIEQEPGVVAQVLRG